MKIECELGPEKFLGGDYKFAIMTCHTIVSLLTEQCLYIYNILQNKVSKTIYIHNQLAKILEIQDISLLKMWSSKSQKYHEHKKNENI